MTKKNLMKILIDDIYSEAPKENYPTSKILYNHIDDIWRIDLTDIIVYETSNNKGYRYIFIILDNSSKYTWSVRLKNKNKKTITEEFSNILTTSKTSPVRLESYRGDEF